MINQRNMIAIRRKAVSVLRTLTILALAVPILHSTAMLGTSRIGGRSIAN